MQRHNPYYGQIDTLIYHLLSVKKRENDHVVLHYHTIILNYGHTKIRIIKMKVGHTNCSHSRMENGKIEHQQVYQNDSKIRTKHLK